MKYVFLFLLCLIPIYSLASEPVNECFAVDDTYYKLSYFKKGNYGSFQYRLFISSKNGNDKLSLNSITSELNDNNTVKEIMFRNLKKDVIKLNSLKPKTITINDEVKQVKKIDCYTFLSTYDRFIDEKGQSISIYTKGKNFMEEKFKDSTFQPSFNCKKAESNIEKAICSNSEVSYLDNLFHSMNKCYEKEVSKVYKDKDTVNNYMNDLAQSFLDYRNKAYKSNGETFSAKELEQVKKAYMLGIIFTPMTISAEKGDLFILGEKLFMSYYMLSTQGITYKNTELQKGLGNWLQIIILFMENYDEIMYYYAGVYDNMNKRLPNLFYYTVYLLEKYDLVDKDGNFKCEIRLP